MEFSVKRSGSDKEREYLHARLQEHNRPYFTEAGFENLSVCLEQDGEIVAGIAGVLRGNWVLMQELWVREDLRGQNLGSQILKKAEEEAKRCGCKHVLLDTFEFQAPGFYKKLGYEEAFVYAENPHTGNHYYLTKKL